MCQTQREKRFVPHKTSETEILFKVSFFVMKGNFFFFTNYLFDEVGFFRKSMATTSSSTNTENLEMSR